MKPKAMLNSMALQKHSCHQGQGSLTTLSADSLALTFGGYQIPIDLT